MKLSPAAQVILAILTAPGFLATAALGIVKEVMQAANITNGANFTAAIVASAAARPKTQAQGNEYAATLRGGVQITGVLSPHMVNVKLRMPADWAAKPNGVYGDSGVEIVNSQGETRFEPRLR